MQSFLEQARGSRYVVDHTMIAVTFALPAESSEFLRQLGSRSRADRDGISIVRGNIGDHEVNVLHTGVGEKACGQRLARFLENHKFDFLISSGFAGALNDQLQLNDLLLAKNFSTVHLNPAQLAGSGLSIRKAHLVTLPVLIDSKEERERVARESGAAAVDMETEFITRACAMRGIPVLSLRIITDTPLQPFPAPPNVLFDVSKQRTNLVKLAAFFLAHPKRLPSLAQFTRRIARSKKKLADALATIVGDL